MNTNFVTSTTLELGAIDGPLLVFGGPCSNYESTRAILDYAEAEGYRPDQIICTGDLAAYCADPAKTVELIRRHGIYVAMGNCEESLGANAEDCGCGFQEGSSCDLLSDAWYRHAQSELTEDDAVWMQNLPQRIRFEINGSRALVIHGSVSEINQFVFPGTDLAVKEAEMQAADADIVIGGHSGVPFTQAIGDGVWHNPGIIGIPANDGTPRVWYSTLTPVGEGIQFAHHALHYDHLAAANRIRETTVLPNDYAETIENGLWPSDDVMPAADREHRGHPVAEHSVEWAAP